MNRLKFKAVWGRGGTPQVTISKAILDYPNNMCQFDNYIPFESHGFGREDPQVTISKANLDYPNNYMWYRFDSLEPFKSYGWGGG